MGCRGLRTGGSEMKRLNLLIISVGASFAAPGLSQPAQAPAIVAVSSLQPGLWSLRSLDAGGTSKSICVRDAVALLQVRHSGAVCTRFVIANNPRDTTVHYTCPGSGYGRTTIRVETARLVQIESQGVANNEPFAVHFEGRRTADCGALTSSLPR
jgi:hypothetical protein